VQPKDQPIPSFAGDLSTTLQTLIDLLQKQFALDGLFASKIRAPGLGFEGVEQLDDFTSAAFCRSMGLEKVVGNVHSNRPHIGVDRFGVSEGEFIETAALVCAQLQICILHKVIRTLSRERPPSPCNPDDRDADGLLEAGYKFAPGSLIRVRAGTDQLRYLER
jgi:hypothetical protein